MYISESNGWTPLTVAAANGHRAIVDMLVSHNADLNMRTSDGWTAAMCAASQGTYIFTLYLLSIGVTLAISLQKKKKRWIQESSIVAQGSHCPNHSHHFLLLL